MKQSFIRRQFAWLLIILLLLSNLPVASAETGLTDQNLLTGQHPAEDISPPDQPDNNPPDEPTDSQPDELPAPELVDAEPSAESEGEEGDPSELPETVQPLEPAEEQPDPVEDETELDVTPTDEVSEPETTDDQEPDLDEPAESDEAEDESEEAEETQEEYFGPGIDGAGFGTANPYATILSNASSALMAPPAMRHQMMSSSPVIGTDHPSLPGQVMLFKQAEAVPGMVNTWDISVRVEAMDAVATNDIVLILDRSGSMQGDKLANAKAAAGQFVNQLLTSDKPNIRIALLSFNDTVTQHTGFLDYTAKQSLLNAISGLTAINGTFTQAAVKTAHELLASSSAQQQQIVLLSDGEPTFGYRLHNPDDYLSQQYIESASSETSDGIHSPQGNRWATTSGMPGSQFDYTATVGRGKQMFSRYHNPSGTSDDKYYNLGNSAIAEAGYAKGSGLTFHTIALGAGGQGTPVLQAMASPGNSYVTTDPSELGLIFEQIAGQIQSAVKLGQVNDPMGLGFSLSGPVSSIIVDGGSVVLHDGPPQTIDWQIGTLTKPIEPGSPIKYAQITYRVEITDDILLATPEGDLYKTNGITTLNYSDVTGNPASGLFPEPQVDPVLLIVEKVLTNDQAEPISDARQFDIRITSNQGYDETYTLSPGQRRIMTNLRLSDVYQVIETGVSGTPASDIADYDTTITIYGVTSAAPAEFEIDHGSPDTSIVVTNQEKALGKLTVKKIFHNLAIDSSQPDLVIPLAAPLAFDFVLTRPDGTSENFSLSAGQTKVFSDLPAGTYHVHETTPGYITTYDPADGIVDISFGDREKTITVTNRVEQNINVTAKKIWAGQVQEIKPDIWFRLYRESAEQALAPVGGLDQILPVPTGPGNEYSLTWPDLPEYDPLGNRYSYSVREVYPDGADLVPAGYHKTEDGLIVTNQFVTPDQTNITSLKFVKTWLGVTPGTNPVITLEVYDKTTGETIRTAQLTYPESLVEWKNLPYRNSLGEVIDYAIRETDTAGFTPSPATEIPSAIDTIVYTQEQSSTAWSISQPSFVITRTTRNGPFVIWTLNHLPAGERTTFLNQLFNAAGSNPAQPIHDLKANTTSSNPKPIIWLEGPSVSHDIFPGVTGVGEISVAITFDDQGAIDGANLNFEGQNTWTHFAVGRYSSKEIQLTNTYQASGSWTPQVVKVLQAGGRTLRAGEFQFVLKDHLGHPIGSAVANQADGTVTFPAINYSQADINQTFNYTIEEVIPSPGETGMTYDNHKLGVEVSVTDGGSGQLIVTAQYDAEARFDNHYQAVGSYRPQVTKLLTGRALRSGEFEFVLQDEAGRPMGDPVTNQADGTVIFPAINYTQDDIGQTFVYRIVETRGSLIGVGYDETVIQLSVRVADGGNGEIVTRVDYSPKATFDNTYTPIRAGAIIRLQKVIEGRDWLDNDSFEFSLSGQIGDTPVAQTITVSDGEIYGFASLSFTHTGVYSFSVAEIEGNIPGIAYDTTPRTVTISVVDNEGVLSIVVEPELLIFTNQYQAEPAGAKVQVKKNLTGRDWQAGDRFTINLSGRIDDEEIEHSLTLEDDTIKAFPELTFSQAGQYTLSLSEAAGSLPGITYDTTPKTVTIDVTDNLAGKLIARINPAVVEFNNQYQAAPVSAEILVKKLLTGRDWQSDDSFAVQLTGQTDTQTIDETIHLTDASETNFTGLSFSQAGEYHFTVQELTGDLPRVSYDTTPKTVTVSVTDDLNGQLSAQVTPSVVEISNHYTKSNFTLTKTAREDRFYRAGDTIHYQVVITNTGEVDITDPVIDDTLVDVADMSLSESLSADGILAIGETWTLDYTYRVTDEDVANARLENVVTVTDRLDPDDPRQAEEEVPLAGLTVDKQVVQDRYYRAGDQLDYRLIITNTGQVALDGLTIVDSLVAYADMELTESLSNNGILDVDEIWQLDYQYTVTSEDVVRGYVLNTVRVTDPNDPEHPTEDEALVLRPSFSVDKTASSDRFYREGDMIDYLVSVVNTGELDIENLTISDSLVPLSQMTLSESLTADDILQAGETWHITYRYAVTSDDVSRGYIYNLVSLIDPLNPDEPQQDDETVYKPAFTVEKTAAQGSYQSVGDTINYTVQIVNTGQVNLENLVINDSLVDVADMSLSESQTADLILEVGETWTLSYDYTVTLEDVLRGHVLNVVTVTDPLNPDEPQEDDERVELEEKPGLSVQKTAHEKTYHQLGDIIHYTVTVVNQGNVAINNLIIEDSLVDFSDMSLVESLTQDGHLQVGESWTLTYQYEIVQSDLDRGHVLNLVSATDPTDPDHPVTDEHEVPGTKKPALDITKSAGQTSFKQAGDMIDYRVIIRNNGNVTLSNLIVKDSLIAFEDMTLVESKTADNHLEVGESWSLTYRYKVTQADVERGYVLNSVSAHSPEYPGVIVTDQVEVPRDKPKADLPRTGQGSNMPLLMTGIGLLMVTAYLEAKRRSKNN